jgi:long-chain acyl-CoA synthetase
MTGKTLLGLSRFFYEYFSMPVAKKLLQPLHDRVGPDLRLLASGGAPLDPELAQTLETLGWTVATGYGLTETAPMLTIVPPESRRFDTAGQPIPGVELRIAQMESGATGDIGEIQAKGPNVFNGYHGLAEETRKAFTDDGWYRTGDRGWMEADGHLHVLGRSATFVVTSSGQNISIENVEQAYERHWLIEEAGVFMRDNRLCAVIRPDPKALRETEGSAEQAVQKAMREIAERRPERERIARFALTAEPLERTRIGDLQRDKLVARYDTLKQGLEGGAEGPQPIEEMNRADQDLLADKTAHETWSLLSKRYPGLRLTPGSHMDVDLGVDSLEWAGLTLDLRDRVGVELDEESIGRIETVRDLLQEVRDRAETAASAADVDPADEPERFIATEQRKWLRPLNAVQRGFAWFLFALNRLVMKTVFRLEVQGQDNLKEDSQVVITPNHTSFLDPFAIAAALPYDVFKRSAFAASTAVAFANPFFRFIVRHGRTFPIEPGRAALSNLAMTYALVDEGLSLVWFPEGFRSPDGELQSVKPGIGAVLEKRASPVVPTIIAGAHEAMPVGRRFPRPRRISVHFGEAISSAKLAEKGEGERTKERIASGLGSAMAALKSKVSS